MKKVIAVLIVLGIGGWLCYSKGVFSMVTGGKIEGPSGASGESQNADPYVLFQKGDYPQAIDILQDRILHEKGEGTPQDLKVLGECYHASKSGGKAKKAWTVCFLPPC